MVGNVHALLAHEAQNEIEQQETSYEKKYDYKINKNIGIAILKDNLIEARLMKKNLVPIRPERSFSRKKKHLCHKYHMNQR
jgi:hypothetical protein